jgi:hypothetical protein
MLIGLPAVPLTNLQTGSGNKTRLQQNLEQSGLPVSSINFMDGDSMQVTANNFSLRGTPAFRMLSVDGGHTLEVTLHDLMLASCVIQDGGLVILDDFPHPGWLGVGEALMHWVHAQDRLVPFMYGADKVWLTTPSHMQVYKAHLATNPSVFPCSHAHVSRYTIGGYHMCWTGID